MPAGASRIVILVARIRACFIPEGHKKPPDPRRDQGADPRRGLGADLDAVAVRHQVQRPLLAAQGDGKGAANLAAVNEFGD